MERVGGVAAVLLRFGERAGDLEELEIRTRPPVAQDQRNGVR